MTHHGGTTLRGVAVMTMNDHDDIEPDDGRDPSRMSADERRAELACILARGLRGAIIEHRADGSLSREIRAVSATACLDLSPDLRLTVCHAADGGTHEMNPDGDTHCLRRRKRRPTTPGSRSASAPSTG